MARRRARRRTRASSSSAIPTRAAPGARSTRIAEANYRAGTTWACSTSSTPTWASTSSRTATSTRRSPRARTSSSPAAKMVQSISTPERITRRGRARRWRSTRCSRTPATVEYRITDESGARAPAKITLVSLDDAGPAARARRRAPPVPRRRPPRQRRAIASSTRPRARARSRIEPGRYRIRASRGPEYSIFEKDVTLGAGELKRFDAIITREVDTTGWMSTDMHLHSQPSFDSGMPLPAPRHHGRRRAGRARDPDRSRRRDRLHADAARALPRAATWPRRSARRRRRSSRGTSSPSRSSTTRTIDPTHGSHDPTCQSGGEILDALRRMGDGER